MVLIIVLFILFRYNEAPSIAVRSQNVALVQGEQNSNTTILLPILLFTLAALIIILFVCFCCKDKLKFLINKWLNCPKYELIIDGGYILPSPLKNTRETCYMNSMVQALASSDVFIEEFSNLLEGKDSFQKAKLLKFLLQNINDPIDRNVCTKTNTTRLTDLMQVVNWDKVSQQDAFQLLSAIINAIQNEIKPILVELKVPIPPKFRLLHTFSENRDHNRVQEHLAIAVPLCGEFRKRPGVQLSVLMDAFFSPSEIEDSSNKTQMYIFEEAPKVMIIHIQANEWSEEQQSYVKPEYYIQYQERFTYEFTIQMEVNENRKRTDSVEYKLTAVVRHMGQVSGGHYVTYRKNHGDWYLTNDEQVEKIDFDNTVVPYIMVFERTKAL